MHHGDTEARRRGKKRRQKDEGQKNEGRKKEGWKDYGRRKSKDSLPLFIFLPFIFLPSPCLRGELSFRNFP